MTLHDLLDWPYGADGEAFYQRLLRDASPRVAALLRQAAGAPPT